MRLVKIFGPVATIEYHIALLDQTLGRAGPTAYRDIGGLVSTLAFRHLGGFLKAGLKHLEPVLVKREWLAGSFSVAGVHAPSLPSGRYLVGIGRQCRGNRFFRPHRRR